MFVNTPYACHIQPSLKLALKIVCSCADTAHPKIISVISISIIMYQFLDVYMHKFSKSDHDIQIFSFDPILCRNCHQGEILEECPAQPEECTQPVNNTGIQAGYWVYLVYLVCIHLNTKPKLFCRTLWWFAARGCQCKAQPCCLLLSLPGSDIIIL